MPKKFSDLIQYISTLKEAPVQIQDIVGWFKANGFQDEFYFYPVDVPFQTAAAWMVRKKEHGIPYSQAKLITYIYYSQHHNECWRRLFVCKELMNLFDFEDKNAVDDDQKINLLIRQLIDYHSFNKTVEMASTTEADIMALHRALLCLAPGQIIDGLKEGDVLSKKTNYEIALFLKIPAVMVETILSDHFLTTHTSVKNEVALTVIPGQKGKS